MDLIERVDSINVYKKGSNRAPHKPLYLLYLLAAVQRGRSRMIPFAEIEVSLANALRIFGSRTANVHPEYPFWWLQQDGLSEVSPALNSSYELRKNRSDPKKTSLLKVGAQGGLLERDFSTLSKDAGLLLFICHRILDNHFPITLHEDILEFFGLDVCRDADLDLSASSTSFREDVLQSYGYACAVSGFRGCIEVGSAGIEAAEIFWRNHGGEPAVANGIAMTTVHRKLFHLGLFTLTPEHRVKISPILSDGSPIGLEDGKHIALPADLRQTPSAKALDWHRRWVFRS